MDNQKIRIKLRAYDYRLLDSAVRDIINTVKRTGAKPVGPVPLPTKTERYTVTKSPHVNKTAREQFEIKTHKRLVDIFDHNPQTIDALMKLELSAGIDVEIKL